MPLSGAHALRASAEVRGLRVCLLPALVATVGSVLYCLACGFEQPLCAWFCLVPLLWALATPRLSLAPAIAVSWWFGLVVYLSSTWWVAAAFGDFAGLPYPVAVVFWLGFCFAQGSQFAAYGAAVHLLRSKRGVAVWRTSPAALVFCEWLWPTLLPTHLASSQYAQTQLLQVLSLTGPLGLSFIIALASSAIYAVLMERRVWPAVVSASACGAAWVYGGHAVAAVDRTLAAADKPLRVGIVQANLGAGQTREDPAEALRQHVQQTRELGAGLDLVVWPESAVSYAIPVGTPSVTWLLGAQLTPVLFGGLQSEALAPPSMLQNAAFLADVDGHVHGTYAKVLLLPFAERVPFDLNLPAGLGPHPPFVPGRGLDPLELRGVRYGVFICFEATSTVLLRRLMHGNPSVLVNLANDAWFGVSREPWLHLAATRMRAVETGRFVVRAANTGVSAFIDPAGRVLAQTALAKSATLTSAVVPIDRQTPYVRFGQWVGWLCIAWLVKQAFFLRRGT